MTVSSRLPWLLPGYRFAPALAARTRSGHELPKASRDLLTYLAGCQLSIVSCAKISPWPSCHLSIISSESNTDANPPDSLAEAHAHSLPDTLRQLRRSDLQPRPEPATSARRSSAHGSAPAQSTPCSPSSHTNSEPPPVPRENGGARSFRSGRSSIIGEGDDAEWHRMKANVRNSRRVKQRQEIHVEKPTDLASKMRRLRESLKWTRDANAGISSDAKEGNDTGARLGCTAGGSGRSGSGGCGGGDGRGRGVDPKVVKPYSDGSGPGDIAAGSRVDDGPMALNRRTMGAGGANGADSIGVAADAAVASRVLPPPCDFAASSKSGSQMATLDSHVNLESLMGSRGDAVRKDLDDASSEGMSTAPPKGVGVTGVPALKNSDIPAADDAGSAEAIVGHEGGDGFGGSGGGYIRVIRATRDSLAAAAAAAEHDADLLRRILELQNLRDAELLVYDAGMLFKSWHAAELLCRLPEIDLETTNSGPRTRRLVRFMCQCTLRDLQALPGPLLARCTAAFARLSYVPPETVAPLAAALTAHTGRKLRACSGPELADLAWALASLEQIYGDMHQAVRQPAGAARLACGARVVGYVRESAGGGKESVSKAVGHVGRKESREGIEGTWVQQLELEVPDGGAPVAEAQTVATVAAVESSVSELQGCNTSAWMSGTDRARNVERAHHGLRGATEAVAVAVAGNDSDGRRGPGDGKSSADSSRGSSSCSSSSSSSSSLEQADPDGAAISGDGATYSRTPSSSDPAAEVPGLPYLSEMAAEAAKAKAGKEEHHLDALYGSVDSGSGGEHVLPAIRRKAHPELVWLVPKAMDRLWERLAWAAGTKAAQGKMSGEHLAKVAWAYARVGRADERLYDEVSAAALVLLEPFLRKARAASSAAASPPSRGDSQLRSGDTVAATAAAAAAALARSTPPPLDPTSVTNLVWAFVTVGRRDAQLLSALATVASSYKNTYGNDQMATLARSYAQARHYHEALCTTFAMVARRRHRHLSGTQLVGLIVSLAALRHRDDELAGAVLAGYVRDKRQEMSAEQVVDLMWACAHLGLEIKLGRASPGAGVLGLDPLGGGVNATAVPPATATAHAPIRGSGSPATATVVAVALAGALQRHCEGLPPASLARALWALSLLSLRDHVTLLRHLVSELREQLESYPVESYSQEALLQLYAAAHVLGPATLLPAAAVADEVYAGIKVAMHDLDVGDAVVNRVVAASMYDRKLGEQALSNVGVEPHGYVDTVAELATAAEVAVVGRPTGKVERTGTRDRGQLFEKVKVAVGPQRMYGTDGGAAAATATDISVTEWEQQEQPQQCDSRAHSQKERGHSKEQQLKQEQGEVRGKEPNQATLSLLQRQQQKHKDPGLRRGRPNGLAEESGLYDESWADVNWDRIRIADPSPVVVGTDPRDGRQHGVNARRVSRKAAAAAAASIDALPPSLYDVRKVYDEASGRELWEVVPKRKRSSSGGGGCDSDDPAARVLPSALLSACRVAAAEWAKTEQRKLEDLEAEEEQLWRLDVAAALRDVMGAEARPRWVPHDNTVLADLLVLPPPAPPTSGSLQPFSAAPSLSLAVLLPGDAECTRNPPYVLLGSVRMRQLLLEAAGAQVLVVPHFLWRMMEDTPDEQICLLANLLGSKTR